ncbi:MAG: hypothetical protein HY245_07285 [Rhizobiales bacterium]|nr:hypothetical protein [Hyphomicrobiales bacterium]
MPASLLWQSRIAAVTGSGLGVLPALIVWLAYPQAGTYASIPLLVCGSVFVIGIREAT